MRSAKITLPMAATILALPAAVAFAQSRAATGQPTTGAASAGRSSVPDAATGSSNTSGAHANAAVENQRNKGHTSANGK